MSEFNKTGQRFNILEIFLDKLDKFSDRKAFHINGISSSYRDFEKRIVSIQNNILSNIPEKEKYVGILSIDHIDTYASIFALWFSGKAFVPLNTLNPPGRNDEIIRQMELKYVLSAGKDMGLSVRKGMTIINTGTLKSSDYRIEIKETPAETDAYVLFTSGSTGIPKGVRISRRNLDAFLCAYLEFTPGYSENDSFLQMYDISFDGSVPCYLVALCSGAAVFTVPQEEIKYLYALKLISESGLTVIKMTPSTLYYLRPYFNRINLPHVRVCIFGGEALPHSIADEWIKCVPNALIQNAYGPTETTIDCLIYNYNSGVKQGKADMGVVSLGKKFGDFEYAVISAKGELLQDLQEGELCLAGEQVMSGYWKDEEKTRNVFIKLNTKNGIKKFYRTGDLVVRDQDGFFMYRGRIDDQVQVQGYRVELGEIEQQAKSIVNGVNLAAIAGRNKNGNPEIVLFIGESEDEHKKEKVFLNLQSSLPQYMMPSRIIYVNELPLLINGKTDRKKLTEIADLYEII